MKAEDSSPCELIKTDVPRVYMINGKSLKECIAANDSAIVYIWDINCRSTLCYSPDIVSTACHDKDVDLYIVAEYYDSEPMSINYNTEKPMFGIDTDYYKSNLTSKYLSKFIYDITGQKDSINGFFAFKNGKIIRQFNSIDEI